VIALGTSVVVRYLIGSPSEQAQGARDLVDGPGDLGLPLVTVIETAHVLRSVYRVETATIVDALTALVQREDLRLLDLPHDHLLRGLTDARARTGRPIPDALIVATARASGATVLATFDRDMRRYGFPTSEP